LPVNQQILKNFFAFFKLHIFHTFLLKRELELELKLVPKPIKIKKSRAVAAKTGGSGNTGILQATVIPALVPVLVPVPFYFNPINRRVDPGALAFWPQPPRRPPTPFSSCLWTKSMSTPPRKPKQVNFQLKQIFYNFTGTGKNVW